MFKDLLHNDWLALYYITSYNVLYNGFFKTLIFRSCSWTGTELVDAVVGGCRVRAVEGTTKGEEQVARYSRTQPGKKASEDGERWRQLAVN